MIVFCSDNGPVLDDGYKDEAVEKNGSHRAAGQYSGGKYSVYEGGTRTPFITYWPGRIQPAESSAVVCTVDLASSLAALTETDIPQEACVDSLDVLSALLGDSVAGRDHVVQQDNGSSGSWGLRIGDWKLQRHDRKSARNVKVEQKLANNKVPQYQLFNLKNDPSEKNNVMKQHPDVADRMVAKLKKIIEDGRTRE